MLAQNGKEPKSNSTSDVSLKGKKTSADYLQIIEGFWQDGRQGVTGTRLQSGVFRILQGSGQRTIQHHCPESYHLEQWAHFKT